MPDRTDDLRAALEEPARLGILGADIDAAIGHARQFAPALRPARRIGGKKGWVHIASGYDADVAPLLKMNVPVIWVNRRGEKLDGRKKPDAEVRNFRDAAKKLGAGG